jgi:FixJ family two-component response regulator
VAAVQSTLDEGIPFDAAIVDLYLAEENASSVIQVLSEREIPIVISTGADIDLKDLALSNAVGFLQKPYNDKELIEALVEWAVTAPNIEGTSVVKQESPESNVPK